MNEPQGLDQFIGAVPSAEGAPPVGGAPHGLDQFIGPEINEEKYGGLGGMAKSAGLGALSGATLGASNLALTKMGLIDPETLKALQDTNPVSSGAGEVAGAIGSMIVAPELSPVSMISKLGKATQVASKVKLIPAATAMMDAVGLGGAKAAKVLATASDLGSHALGSAVEGALYSGLGNTMNEYSIGDPGLNGEKLASVFGHNLGEGALYGGVLGGALKAGSSVLPEAVGAMKNGINKVKELAVGTGEHGSGGLAGKALGLVDDTGKLSEAWGTRMTNLDSDQQAKQLKSLVTTINEVHNNGQTALKDFNGKIRPQAVEALIDTADKKAVVLGQQGVIDDINNAISEINDPRNAGIYSPNAGAKLEKMRLRLVEGLKEGNEPADIFNRTKDVFQDISNWGRGVMKNETTGDTKDLLSGLSQRIGGYLKNPEVFGDVGAGYAEHNNFLKNIYDVMPAYNKTASGTVTDLMTNVGTKTSPRLQFDEKKILRAIKSGDQTKLDRLDQWFDVMKTVPTELEKAAAIVPNEGMDKLMLDKIEQAHLAVKDGKDALQENIRNAKGKRIGMGDYAAAMIATAHPVLGGLMELYNLASKPLESINKLAEIEHLINKSTNLIGRGSKAIFDPSIKLGELSKGVATGIGTREHQDEHEITRGSLAQMANDPKLMMSKLTAATDSLHSVAPDTAQALQMATVRATQFLASKLPQHADQDPFSSPYVPSKTELAVFERYRQVVEKPLTALAQVRDLTIGPEAIEALMVVHPKLYDAMKSSVIETAANRLAKKETIPFQTKQAISFFLGQPLDQAMNFQSVMANQQSYQQAMSQSQNTTMNTARPSKTGMQKMTLAQRTGLGRDPEEP